MHRASAALSLPVNPTNIVGEWSGIRNRNSIIPSFSRRRGSHSIRAVSSPFQPGNVTELMALAASNSGTYVNLQRRYMSLMREKCGSAQALGAEIRRIHAEKLLLDPDCVTSEIERVFFFMHALGAEYEAFRDHIFRQMDLVNDRDADGNVIKVAPTFDYIENKAIEEEHKKGQLGKQSTEAHIFPALALIRGPGQKNLIPSSDGTTCRIEIDNVPYCSFCRKPYHAETECFKKNPKLQGQRKDEKGYKARARALQANRRKPSKRQHSTDNEDDDAAGPKNPNSPPSFNAAFAHGVERSGAHIPTPSL